MSADILFELRDPRLIAYLERMIGVSLVGTDPLTDFAELVRRLAGTGWIVDVRPLLHMKHREPLPDGGISVVRSGTLVGLIGTINGRAGIITPDGRVLPVRWSNLQQALNVDTANGSDSRLSRGAARALRRLGPVRASRVREWLDRGPAGVRSASEVYVAAARDEAFMPFEVPPLRASDAPIQELRLVRRFAPGSASTVLAILRRAFMLEWRLILSLAALTALSIVVGFVIAILASTSLDMAVAGDQPPWVLLGLAASCMLVVGTIDGLRLNIGQYLTTRLRIRLSHEILLRILRARADLFRRLSDGDLLTRFADLQSLQSLVLSQSVPLLMTASTLVGGLVYLKTVVAVPLWPFAVVTAVGAAIVTWCTPRLCRLRTEQLKALSKNREQMIERFEYRRTMRHLDRSGFLLSRIDHSLTWTNELGHRSVTLGASMALMTGALGVGTFAVVANAMARRYSSGELTTGTIAVALGLVMLTFNSLLKLMWIAPTLAAAQPAFDRLQEILDVASPEAVPNCIHRHRHGPLDLSVRGLQVSRGNDSIIDRLDLDLKPGEWAAIQGASGSGKSTLAQVLVGLLTPCRGTITLDGVRTSILDPGSLRLRIGLVPQSPMLFSRTVLQNLVPGRSIDRNDPFLAEIIAVCDLDDCVAAYPLGLDGIIIGNGANLSVGEKARIALARALMRSPGLLILDETLSHLDPPSADRVVGGLRELGVSVLLLTHDQSHLDKCDRCYRLESGQLSELLGPVI